MSHFGPRNDRNEQRTTPTLVEKHDFPSLSLDGCPVGEMILNKAN